MKTIFVVDDNDTNRAAAIEALDGVYRTFPLPNASRMFKLCEKVIPDLILLDIEMPEMDGFTAMKQLRVHEKLKDVPVVFLTARQDHETETRCLESGALDFISKPFSASVLRRRIKIHIETDALIKESQKSLRNNHFATISVLAKTVEERDTVTGGHIDRTQRYLDILIKGLIDAKVYVRELARWDMDLLLPSAQLHDLGKIKVSDTILNKPGKLTAEEFAVIKTHPTEGERIIDEILSHTGGDDFLLHAKNFAGYHHERWDGSGYPHGLAGTDIPLEGRMMAIADVYDALVSPRPYKTAFSHEKAVEIIQNSSGTHFDPDIVAVFLRIAGNFADVQGHHRGKS